MFYASGYLGELGSEIWSMVNRLEIGLLSQDLARNRKIEDWLGIGATQNWSEGSVMKREKEWAFQPDSWRFYY